MRREAEPAAPLVIRMGVPTREGVRERGVFGVLDMLGDEDENEDEDEVVIFNYSRTKIIVADSDTSARS